MTTSRSDDRQGHRCQPRRVGVWLRALPLGLIAFGALADVPVPALTPSADLSLAVPSGQAMTLVDVVLDAPGPDGPVARYRFLAPGIARNGGTIGFAEAAADLQALCDLRVVPDLARIGPLPGAVILSVADREVAFGETDPEATQFFTAFQIVDRRCILEPF